MLANEKEILNEMLGNTKSQFIIPVYQRNYDWTKKECERLFEDILILSKDKNKSSIHFLGAFVYKPGKREDTRFDQLILIDGQQRLTTIILLLKAIHDYSKNVLKDEKLSDEIYETYLVNKFAKTENLKLKLKPSKLDDHNYAKLMNDKIDEVSKNSNVYLNYFFFYEKIGNLNKIQDFYLAMQRIEGIAAELQENDNPQVIFESLNSTGLDLNSADLIRNFLLMKSDVELQNLLYEKYWMKLENLLEKNLINFIRDYLSFKSGYVVQNNKKSIYDSFRKYFSFVNISSEDFLIDMLRHSKVYIKLITYDLNLIGDLELINFNSLEMSSTFPFLLGILIENSEEFGKRISDQETNKIISTVESYVLRRNICNLQGGGLSSLMAQMFRNLKEKYGENFYKETNSKIANYLAGIANKGYFPSDEEFYRELTTRDMYQNRNIKYILTRIEKNVQGKEIINLDSLSVEHVMPQNLSDEWIRELSIADYEKIHLEKVNKIGNLTLTAYNSEMSNKLFKEKQKNIDFSRLILNNYFKNVSDWNFLEIDKRNDNIAKIILSIWKYPKIENISDISKREILLLNDDDFDYSGTKPLGIKINGNDIRSNSWTDLYTNTLKYLYSNYKEPIIDIIAKDNSRLIKSSISLENTDEFRVKEKIDENFIIETNNNSNQKIKIMKLLFSGLRFNEYEVILFIE
jgi:hypothetical protein